MKKILIIRQAQQTKALARYLEQQKCQIFIEPLFAVKKNFNKSDCSKYRNKNVSAILITSQNAIYALKRFNYNSDIKIFAVGKKTAEKIVEAGFINVSFPKESCVAKLLKLIKESNLDKTGLILYFRGETISFDLKNSLQNSGYNCEEILTYKTIAKNNFL